VQEYFFDVGVVQHEKPPLARARGDAPFLRRVIPARVQTPTN
jgi:hypothetical protein